MTPSQLKKLDRELSAFLDEMVTGMGRPERRSAMRNYITGLLLDGERTSVQPMAARLTRDAAECDRNQRLKQGETPGRLPSKCSSEFHSGSRKWSGCGVAALHRSSMPARR